MLEKYLQASRRGGLVLILVSALVGGAAASAQSLNPLVNFDYTSTNGHGANPYAGLLADANGDLFGTTYSGGASNAGTVFKIVNTGTPSAPIYTSTPTILVSFNGTDGSHPYAGLIDANGDLFGTTYGGGDYGDGTVFEILNGQTTCPNGSSSSNGLCTLYSFAGGTSDGAHPEFGSLVADASGDLFGLTYQGGVSSLGTVFELSPASTSTGYAESFLASFDGSHGGHPYGSLIMDGASNLFGTTSTGGSTYAQYVNPGDGTVFEIAYDPTTGTYASTPATLVSFDSSNGDGVNPEAGLIADANGNLFGTTYSGGEYSAGTVFEIVKDQTTGAYANTPTTLASFNPSNGTDGSHPHASLIIDSAGNLFGTTYLGGANSDGAVFEVPTDSTSGTGYASQPLTLISFHYDGSTYLDGTNPYAGLIADGNGNLFGTTRVGGSSDLGTAFEITASGFVTATQQPFVGTPGTPNCTGDSISNLTHTYGGIGHAASSLGYASVKDLQNAVSQYCSQ